jgi:predicted transporter
MPDGLGSLLLFAGVIFLMTALLWRQRKTGGFQEKLIQLTRTSISLVATFTIFYAMLHEIPVSEGLLALYGVIITLYFKGEKVIRGETAPPDETKQEDE